jgi:serine/threonine-protein kinase HipA
MRVRADVVLESAPGVTRRVGAVAESGGRVAFQYHPEFLAQEGASISPILMPLARRVYEFPSLRRSEAFHGLPGVLADSLPDRFGTRVMDAYFRARGQHPDALSAVQRLLYVGARGMGALSYAPSEAIDGNGAIDLPLTLGLLRDQARRAIRGEAGDALREIMAAASSAGGMRAKALVAWNRAANEIDYSAVLPQAGFEPWLIKFDGVGEDGAPQPWCRTEFAYMRLAEQAGIEVPEVALIEDGPYRHFAARRFDRTDAGHRIHMASLCGLQHVDYNLPAAVGYELLCDTCHALHLGAPAIEEVYRRMVFNVVARNQDDHTKNFCFLMDPETFEWYLSPGFDLTYANGNGWTRTHQMTVSGKASGIERDDLLQVARRYGVRRGAQIIDEVVDAMHGWPDEAGNAGLDDAWIERIRADQRLDLGVTQAAGMSPGF